MTSHPTLPVVESGRISGREDRRAYIRYCCSLQVCCEPIEPQETGWWCEIQDISNGGVTLFLRHPLESATGLLIELPSRKPDQMNAVPACVIHCDAEPDGRWRIGCQFVRPLTSRELATVLYSAR